MRAFRWEAGGGVESSRELDWGWGGKAQREELKSRAWEEEIMEWGRRCDSGEKN